MYKSKITLILFLCLFIVGCRGSHAIFCVNVDQEEICFKREVWGFNGDKVWITKNKNVCRKPSEELDFISNKLIDGNSFLFKIEGKKLYVFDDAFLPPKEDFPVEVIRQRYDPLKVNSEILIKKGYQKVDLSTEQMTSCLSDLF